MDVKMEDVIQEKACIVEELLEIDFDYEFDVAKFFDFTKIETSEEIMESELWFEFFQGHLPSPMLVKLDKGADDLADSFSSPRYGPCDAYPMDNYSGKPQYSLNSEGKKGSMMLKSKLKPTSQSKFPVNSRLLQPTASHLAKQDQYTVAHSTRVSRRHQRHGNPLKSPGETDATKRQKLEIGYLRKVAQLKHLTSFLHKPSKKVGTTDVNSHAKPKTTVPKEPNFATANRARQSSNFRSKNAPELGNDAKYSGSSFRAKPLNGKIQETQSSAQTKIKIKPPLPKFQSENARSGRIANGSRVPESKRANFNKALLQENSDQVYNFTARLVNKKISSTKGDIGVLQNYKESTVSREFKLRSNRKLSQNPPSEMFSKLSLNPKTHPISLPGQDLLEVKASKKVLFANMKENENANVVTGNPMRCFGNAGRMLTDIGNQITSARTFKIY
ncbi:uncharacterized protein LOC130806996 isoform X3 [Amaranthus tricolor]|uniref:uncharacterized protein LOC130806996 isoform X3 n=1 Tax=Amaranthus tricolor TaxID=29722 RepID=UPI002587764F|nr:uncharacterized protein LOC130806996 isoform X3 [Amaranthus tricolor]